MTVTLLNPDGLLKPDAYHQVSIATGSRHVHVAGQVGWDEHGRLVADDLTGQVAQAFRNVGVALQGAGATFADVVRLNIYVVDWTPEKFAEFSAGVEQVAGEVGFVPAPSSLIEVVSLFQPGVLVEVEATAILD